MDIRTDAEIIESDPFYIRTASPVTDDRSLVLKEGDSFVLVDRHGDIRPEKLGEEGLYHEGTRHLSRLTLTFSGRWPLLLSAAVRNDNAGIAVDLTNPDLIDDGVITVPRGTLHLAHMMVLSNGVLHNRLRLRNYGMAPVRIVLGLEFDADFVDIFEVRGTPRARRGQRLDPVVSGNEVVLGYRGLDDVVRRTRLIVESPNAQIGRSRVLFDSTLPPHGEQQYTLSFGCESGGESSRVTFPVALDTVTESLERRRREYCEVTTSNQQFNNWLSRSLADMSMMVTSTRQGEYPYAGVPWFSTPFGRDGIITALECLWINPSVARGVLSFLAATQATVVQPDADAQPGKILHEMRSGEMAATGEIPFGRYYGSHDATPLFVMLAAAYYERTDDATFIERLWPAIEAALHWIERDGDLDGDGFVEYARQSPGGLVQQGWKDSHDSVFHDDGDLATAPIAMCEIQAYAYGAWRGAASLATAIGQTGRAQAFARKANALFERFDAAFWNDSISTYALALDGSKRQCAVRASNAGHTLFSGIAPRHRAGSVARTIMAPEGFSGWGIRTLSTSEIRYNPMSYHNGSIWPHDNALIALGLTRYGFHDEALAVLTGLFEASLFMDLHRLPELFCGFARERGEGPISYPVACNPQAWASASVFLLVQAVLGLEVRAADRVVKLTRPRLPAFIDEISIRNLRVGPDTLDLVLERHENDVGTNVVRRTGSVEVIAIK
ncbi:MAG TPA: amylo-alpha-1,6-glucosidase [Vicinamibacterales bacterium]|nr:amylo-alpha-1,6-glucosidase [Vicinamibacterales bacterium]